MIMPLSEDQTDVLQEVVNMAMGQAGNSLARILDVFVCLSVPRIRLVTASEVLDAVLEMVGSDTVVSAARQAFYNHLRGEAVVIFGQAGCRDLAVLMGYDEQLDANSEQELLLEVSNVLVGACMCCIGDQLGADLSFSAPSLMAERVRVSRMLATENLSWTDALLVEVNFGLENSAFKSHLLILMTEEAIDSLRQDLDKLLEAV
ncbi:MAG: hypothetical protein AB1790_04210 [Pseudomonadota bacterium]